MTGPERRALRWARGLYRLVARLYPAELRTRYGAEMEEAFADQARATAGRHGWPGLLSLTLRTAWGAARARFVSGGFTRSGGGAVEWRTEIRRAIRGLLRSPGFAFVTVTTLALGVGAFGSVSGNVAGVLARPMPYERPADLHWVWRDYWGTFSRGWLGGPDIARLQEHDEVVEAMIALRNGRANLSGPSGTEPRDVRVTLSSPGLFETLGVSPRIGPGFTPVAVGPEAPDEAVLGDLLWRTTFGADPSIVGRDIYLDGDPYRVVGVLPPDVDFVVHSSLGEPSPADLYIPLAWDLPDLSAGSGSMAGLVRVRAGSSEAALAAALAEVSTSLDREFFGNRGFRLWSVGLKEDLVAGARTPLLAVLTASGILLLILGANLATLFLSRAREREHDAAVRAALGAGRAALFRTAGAEAVVVTLAGLGAGTLLAMWGAELLASAARDVLPRAAELGFDLWAVTGAVGAATVLALLSMTGPAFRFARTRPTASLREGGTARGSSRGGRGRGTLVVVQLALALTLVVGAGLLTRSLAALLREDPGFDPGIALTARVSFEGPAYPDSATIVDAQRRLVDRLAGLPGVTAAGLSNALPLGLETNQSSARFPGAPGARDEGDGGDGELVDWFSVTPGYVEAAGLRVLRGRALEEADAGSGALIDDVLAGRYFPAGGAVGSKVLFAGDTLTVVGVVDQARFYDVAHDDRGQLYVPRAYAETDVARLVVRLGQGDALGLVGGVRAALAEMDPTLPLAEVRPLDAIVRDALGPERLNLRLVGAFALAALVLAGLGLYGVVNGSVLQRRREIGIRMAVGAEPGRVRRMVLGQGFALVVMGVVAGLGASWVVGRLLASLLHGVEPFDPLTYAGAAGVLGALALLASWVPARRATRIRPLEALRSE